MTVLQILIFISFIINSTVAIDFAIRFGSEKKPKVETNTLVMCILISSAIWSGGLGIMSVQTNPLLIYIFRMIGIAGCFAFMISVQMILCMISEIPRPVQRTLNYIALSGLLVFGIQMIPGQTLFVSSDWGVTFYLQDNWITKVYSLYFSLVSIDILAVTVHMIRHHKLARVRTIGKRFMVVELLVFVGAILDMFLPTNGKPAFPGSAITHFWGVMIFWFAIHGMYQSQITISNMSEYIYYSLDIPVLVFDSDKKLRIINDAAMSFFGESYDRVSSQDISIERYFNVNEDIYDFSERSILKEAVCRENKAPCQLSVSKIQDNYRDVIGYIIIVNDLTEHYSTIKELEDAKLTADAANMSKSLFLANMSHEIRTPMNAILGFAELALGDSIDEVAREYISDIKQSGETLLSIINDVLNISRIELGKYELNCGEYEPAKIFGDVELIIGVQSKNKGLDFTMKIDEEFPKKLWGDKDKIREILINVLNNSVKYTKVGSLRLDARVVSTEEGIAVIQFVISDTGIGIKSEDIDKIFEKFSRMDQKKNSTTEGTGLGLSITKGLIEMMEGSIKVESEYEKGSVFTINIPQRIVDSAPITLEKAAEETQTNKVLRFTNVKFLAVDDNKINLKVISKRMNQYGIEYDLAPSGLDAISQCKTNIYDIILMDQMMPVMDGVEAMKTIRKLPGYGSEDRCKIVALTANVIEGVREELLEEGFDGFMGKPIDVAEFESVLTSLLPEECYYYTEKS